MMTIEEEHDDDARREPVWCSACGIPYVPGTTHCSHCGQPLKTDAALEPPTPAAPAPAAATPDSAVAPAGSPPVTGGSTRPRRRRAPLTEEEIEATAAALVARAMAADAMAPPSATPLQPADGSAPLAEWPSAAELAPRVDTASPPSLRMSGKDRAWLIAGIVMCVLLVLLVIVFVRWFTANPI